LAEWAGRLDDLDEAGVQLIALTAEPEDEARKILDKLDIEADHPGFPIAFGLDVDEVESEVGSYVNRDHDPSHLHATGVILDPAGEVRTVVYSSGAIGRLHPDPMLGMVEFWRSR